MARIPAQEIEQLKSEVSVQRLVEAAGIALKKVGKDLLGQCPFHEDSTPSLSVTPSNNLWHCFGCSAGGGPIDWVMRKNGVSFRHAVELLREGALQTLAASAVPLKRSTVRTLQAPVSRDADHAALLKQVIDYYHASLKHAPEALAYLQSRGLDHPELIDTFCLGYANRTLGLRLPEKNRLAGADLRTRLQQIGIYRDSGHEHFNGSLIVPVFDAQGHVVEVYGRKLLDNLRVGTPKHLYLPADKTAACASTRRGIFNLAALQASPEIILCEALIDAMTFWCAGYRNVTSSYGIEGFTDEHLAAFQQHGTQRVLIAYDRDDAGERATHKLAERLMAQGIECFRIQFPKGMDANEYALKVQPAANSLGLLIRKAVWLGKGQAGNAVGSDTSVQACVRTASEPPAQAATQAIIEVMDVAHSEAAQENIAPSVSSLAATAVVAPPEPLPASPVPNTARALPMQIKDKEITLTLGEGKSTRHYRVRGLSKNLAVDVLKINLLVGRGEPSQGQFHVDTLDLYSAKQRASYIAHAAQETGLDARVFKADLGRVLLALEQLQDEQIDQTLHAPPQPQMQAQAEQAALALLKSPDLVSRILADFATCGLVGEQTNKLVGYLAAVSRKLDKPLGIVIQSSSASGKTSLMDAVLSFVPEEEKVKYSAMTGQSLFYMGETNLKHKALAIVEEEGASRASYALKLLQSEGELTIASTGKDPQSGNLITQQYRVQGPVALLVTTTARDIDEELMNRCLVLSVDEGRQQTRAIHQLQRDKRTLQGLLAKQEKQSLIELHQNAQRLLKPLDILNPYAQHLTFPDQTTRLRRDHEKYLTLIDTIAFLHQHQREIKTVARGQQQVHYIEVTLDDIALANTIAHEVLGRSLDELPPQTRRLLKLIDDYVVAECKQQAIKRTDVHFSRRALREAITWGDTQLRLHLERLVDLEYLLTHREGAGGKYVYELVYAVTGDAHAQVAGLIQMDALNTLTSIAMISKSRANTPEVAGRLRGSSGPVAAMSRGEPSPAEPINTTVSQEISDPGQKPQFLSRNVKSASYPQLCVVPALPALVAG